MKTSWIIGLVMAWLLIFALEMFATGGTSFASTSSGIRNIATENQTALLAPTLQQSTSVFTGAWATITGVADYLRVILNIIFLWCPTVFYGYLLWVWWFICFPVGCGFAASLVFIVRGVHSG